MVVSIVKVVCSMIGMITLVAIFGLIIGSFANVCIYRIPRGESIVYPGSKCTSCGHTLSALDLVPVLSYGGLKGKCRYCGSKISPKYMIVEILTAAMFVSVFLQFGLTWLAAAYCILISILIMVSLIDYEYQIIPDALLVAALIPGIAFAAFQVTGGWQELLIGVAAGMLPLLSINLLSRLVYKKEGMGGGDIKLMAVVGLYIGWKLVLLSTLFGVVLGAVSAVMLMLLKIKQRGDTIPFGPFLCIGIALSMFFGNDLLQWYIGLLR